MLSDDSSKINARNPVVFFMFKLFDLSMFVAFIYNFLLTHYLFIKFFLVAKAVYT